MAFSLLTSVSQKSVDSNGFTTSATDTTGATLLVVGVSLYALAAGTPTFSDSYSNTWTALPEISAASFVQQRRYYSLNPTVGTGHTFTYAHAGSYPAVCVLAFGGATPVFDATQHTTNAGAPPLSTGSITPRDAGEVFITFLSRSAASVAASIGSSFIKIGPELDFLTGQSFGQSAAYKIQAGAATENPSWSGFTSGSPNGAIASLIAFTTGVSTFSVSKVLAGAIHGTADAVAISKVLAGTILGAADRIEVTKIIGAVLLESPPVVTIPKYLILARAFLHTGTEGIAQRPVTHPLWNYEGRALNWGSIERSIPTPTGLPQIGDARIRLADTDNRWRRLFAQSTPRRRMIELKLGRENASEAGFPVLYTGEIMDLSLGPGYAEVILRDVTFAWLDEEIPGFINRTNFPEMAEDEAFLPIIAGRCRSRPENPVGVIAAPHIGWNEVTGDRFGLAAHPVWDVPAVYRLQNPDPPGTTASLIWTLVNPAEYNINQETRTFVEVPGTEFNPTFLDFLIEQPKGTRIRFDCDGMDYRGPWEGIPAAGYHPIYNPSGTPGPLRNPVDVFINIIFLVLRKAGTDSSAFNVDSIASLLQRFAAVGFSDLGESSELGEFALGDVELGGTGEAGESDIPPFFCDGALTEAMTVRSFLSRFLTSFQIDFFQNKDGLITLIYVEETDPLRPVFNDKVHILRDSFTERFPSPTVNRARYRYEHNYATEEWATQRIYDNLEDQDACGDDAAGPLREEDVTDLWWLRDSLTADYVIYRRMSFLALGSYRQNWTMPLPEVYADIELAKLVGITHWAGVDFNGYQNKEVKITGLSLNLDALTVNVSSIVRVPQGLLRGNIIDGIAELQGAGALEGVGETGPAIAQLEVCLEMGDRGFINSNASITTFASSSMYLDPSDYDNALYYFEIVGRNENPTNPYTVELIATATTVASIVMPANTPVGATDAIRLRSEAFTPPAGNNIYQLRTPHAPTSAVEVNAARIIVVQVGASRTRIQVPLLTHTVPNALDNASAAHTLFGSTTYTQQEPRNHTLFRVDKAALATVTDWSFESVGLSTGAANTCAVGLFDRTTGTLVAENFHGPSTNVIDIKAAAISDATMIDGHEYEVRVRSTVAGVNASCWSARLYARINPLLKTLVYRRVGPSRAVNSATDTIEYRQLIYPSLFSPLVETYFEVVAWEEASTTADVSLGESSADYGTTGSTTVAGTTMTFDVLMKTLQRSGALTLANNRYVVKSPAFVIGQLNVASAAVVLKIELP